MKIELRKTTLIVCSFSLFLALAQRTAVADPPLGVPAIAATAKGPDQINLTWNPVSNPGYGYLVEIQSNDDSRYPSFQELRPIPAAQGYTCNSSIIINGVACTTSDPTGVHVYNAPNNGIPYWVTEPQYIDPQDGTPAQFIAAGLKPNATYQFRVRAYSGITNLNYGGYSNVASARTANYTVRYVSISGNDANDGTAPDGAHAWRTIGFGSRALGCGQVLIVMGGNYTADFLSLNQICAPASKAVVMVNPGDVATITASTAGPVIGVAGSYDVVDGLKSAVGGGGLEYQLAGFGDHNAYFNIELYQPVIPTFTNGLTLSGSNSIVYGCYLHDSSSPDAGQNPNLNNGWVLTVQGSTATNNVIWSNHLTRGGHDSSLCKGGCQNNRWLNNVMDGGWSMGWEAIDASTGNLFEGNYIKDPGQLTAAYKPGLEISAAGNTVRRNTIVNAKSNGVELSALDPPDTVVGSNVYNNTIYQPNNCIYEAGNGGNSAYTNVTFSNNICYKIQQSDSGFGVMYSGNPASQFTFNSLEYLDSTGVLQSGAKLIHYYGASPNSVTVAVADTTPSFSPPFAFNSALSSVSPQFVNEVGGDLNLAPASPLRNGGIAIATAGWGYTAGSIDLGATGIPQIRAGAPGTQPPSAPPNVSAVAFNSFQINISWSASSTASGVAIYSVYRDAALIGTTQALSLADTGVLPGTTHSYTVAAVDGFGNRSPQSSPVSASTPAITGLPAQGLIGYWNFDEGSGTVAHDSSGSGYNAAVVGAPWVAGKVNTALGFNGGSNYVVTPGISLGATFSISVWVNPAASQNGYSRLAETEYNGGFYLGTDQSGTRYKLIVNTGAGATGGCGAAFGCAEGGSVASGWHNVIGTYDGTIGRLYVDGVLVAGDTFASPGNTGFPLYIGQYYNGGQGWNGAIDEVRLYNRALTAADVSTIYGYTGVQGSSGLVGYWNFDEGSGAVAHDSSGNGYNAAVSGAAWVAGESNTALSFNSSSSVAVTPAIPLANSFSVALWVNPATTRQTPFARLMETHYDGGFYLGTDQSGSRYQFIVNTGSGATGGCGAPFGCALGGVVAGGWHSVIATFDGATARLYVDGTQVGSDTFTAPANTSFPLYLGQYYGGNGYGWNGAMDEVRLYNRTLTAAEISTLSGGSGGGQGPVGYWNFDENSGAVAHDTSGNGYNATVNSAAWVAGKINSALSFNASTSSVVSPAIPLANAFSVSLWVNPAASPQTSFARLAETRYDGGFYLGTDQSGTRYQWIVNGGAGATGGCGAFFGCALGGAVTGGWHNVIATFDGSVGRLYVDGALVGSDTFTAPGNTSFPLYLGQYYGGAGYGWNGAMDEVRLYNRALTANDVNSLCCSQ